ncbi:isochorismatase family protein [Grosmannia clavigera kw1407]|uniref:Isochorismatase family protein n=1 Tax=Grosmannia clavigera (strain kw1407 / UAMH 11150) TaxID=655863 RepID=F0XPS7_GROCL|nr:isochorismatase family protein [Grosmannia clavigera kw1407]EFX00201.1 isochorismatase family protein [Grosmannia clavigera kw1407]
MSSASPNQRPVAVFVCDIQEKFRNAIYQFDQVVSTSRKVLRAAQVLDIPVFVTTQNRARLGNTVSELASLLAFDSADTREAGPKLAQVVVDADKTRFSMYVPEVQAALNKFSPSAAVVIVGIESHICVTQTALDLLAAQHRVYVLADGVSSCNPQEISVALDRLRAAGATVTTSESWIYEHVGDASKPEFRNIISLVKDTSNDTKTALSALLPGKI